MVDEIKTSDNALIVALYLYMVMLFTPYLNHVVPSIFFAGLFIVVLFLTMINSSNNDNGNRFPFFMIVIFAWCVQIFIYRLTDISTCTYFKIFNHIIELFFYYLLYKLSDLKYARRKNIAFCVMLIFFVNLIDNIRLNIIYPNASELLNFSWGTQFLQMNVGGSTYSALASLFGLLAFVLLLNSERKQHRLFYAIYFASCFLYIVVTGRAISLLSFVLGTGVILLAFLSKKTDSVSRPFFVLSVLYLAGVLVFFILPSVLLTIASSLEGSRLIERLQEIAFFLQMKSSEFSGSSSGSGRIDLYLLSIQTFFSDIQTFLLGIGEHPSNVEILKNYGIGAHSAVFDNLPEYGLFGAIAMFVIFKKQYDFSYGRWIGCKNYLFAKIIFIIWVVNCCLNNTMQINFLMLMYVVVPVLLLEKDVYETGCESQKIMYGLTL